MQIGEELFDVFDQAVAGEGGVVVEGAVGFFGGGPGGPAVAGVDDAGVAFARKLGLDGAVVPEGAGGSWR